MQDKYNVGIYCRLSRDDKNGHLESMSIANQRQMLADYVEERGWNLAGCYIDDGYSGTNFERPDFKRMLLDAESGKINCIITKDLSRLGRNYVLTGYYTEEYFIEHNIRYIAINDGIDTMADCENDLAAFHHVLNEFYPKEVSKKVRQVKRKSAEQGKFMGSQAPFGYEKSPQDKHVLIIDEEAAVIMRRIFHEYANGCTARMIADELNREQVDSPRFYHYKKMGRENPLTEEKNVWGSATITQLLKNQVYIGNMVQGKRQVLSFKTKKKRQIAPENWIVVENTHEPLISLELWDTVQERLKTSSQKVRRTKVHTIGLYSGIIVCGECGSPLAYMRKRLKSGEKGVYRCSRYNNNGGNACSPHYINEEYINAFVLNDIRTYAKLAANEREQTAKRLYSAMCKDNDSTRKTLKSKIEAKEKRLSEISIMLKSLYEDKCTGVLPEDVFKGLMYDFTEEKTMLENHLSPLYAEYEEVTETTKDISAWLDKISQYENLETLNREIVCGLIQSIVVYEKDKSSGHTEQEIRIEYRFIKNLLEKGNEDIA